MTTHTTPTFVQRLAASHLLTPQQLDRALAEAGDDVEALKSNLLRTGLLTRFQLRQLLAGATSFHVDKYVVLDCIGRGGNGLVFKARHTLMGQRLVALKTIEARDLHQSRDAMLRFRREIDIVSNLEHPNIVRAYDVLETRTHVYLVMEFVNGKDLGSLVRERGPLPPAEAVEYITQAARGLDHAHQRGVIHRDLKPANLLLAQTGVVKLSDLGLARHLGGAPSHDVTMKGLCLGTPEFMAPEQAEDSSRADVRSDLYSLGATLFHLLTAELPVGGSSQMECLTRLLTSPPRPLASVRPDVPSGLAAVVDRLRASDPKARPGSAAEVIGLLEPFLKPTPAAEQIPWDGRRRVGLVMEMLRGRLTAQQASSRHGIPLEEVERWERRAVEAAEQALDPFAEAQVGNPNLVRDLYAKIGVMALEIEALKQQLTERAG